MTLDFSLFKLSPTLCYPKSAQLVQIFSKQVMQYTSWFLK